MKKSLNFIIFFIIILSLFSCAKDEKKKITVLKDTDLETQNDFSL